ncbi:hypothetical protein [Azospirillum largimobile]
MSLRVGRRAGAAPFVLWLSTERPAKAGAVFSGKMDVGAQSPWTGPLPTPARPSVQHAALLQSLKAGAR